MTQSAEIFLGEKFCSVSQKFSSSEKFYELERGLSRLSVEKFLYHNAENFGTGTLLCCVSENFRYRKRLCIKDYAYQDFPSKGFSSQKAESFVGENFYAVFQKNSSSEKVYGLERGLSRLSFKSFLYHNSENFGKGTLLCCVSENIRYRKRLCIKGGYQDFPSIFFCLEVPKQFVAEHFCAVFQESSGGEKLYG